MIAAISIMCIGSILCSLFCASILPSWSMVFGSVLFYCGELLACSIWSNHCEHVKKLEERINKLEKNEETRGKE